MDPDLKHQNMDQPLRQQPHDQNNMNPNYTYPEDDFSQFFNQDATWEQTLLDPAMHSGNGYPPQSQAWTQQSQQPVQGTGYASPFSNAQPYPSYPGFSEPPYQQLAPEAFNTAIPYPNTAILQQPGFNNSPGPSFIAGSSLHGETIAPSAIQGYPTPFERFSPNSDRAATPLQAEPQAIQPAPSAKGAMFYDESVSPLYADKIPAGKPQGAQLVKDAAELIGATGADKLLAHLYSGTAVLESDEPRVIFPRIPARKSVKDVKRETLDYQGGYAWDPAQKAGLKKIRIKLAPGKRGRPRKDATVAPITIAAAAAAPAATEFIDVDSTSESSSEESADESEADESEDEEPSPLPKTRPSDAKGSLEYDVLKAVWARRDTMLSGAVIKSALSDYLEIVKATREVYKTASTALASAEAAKSASDVDKQRKKVAESRAMMLQVLHLTLKHGHPDIVERFGSSPLLMSIFYTFLLDRFKENDVNGPMSEGIMKLLSSCTTLNQDLLEKTRLEKILPRFVRKANDQVKQLAQQVLDNAANMSKPKTGDSKEGQPKEAPKKPIAKPASGPEPAAGIKRPRPNDASAAQPAKKPSQPAPPRAGPQGLASRPSLASTKAAVGKAASAVKSDSRGAASPPVTESPPKPKAAPVKPPSLLSGLKSASKRSVSAGDAAKASSAAEARLPARQDTQKAAPARPDPPKPAPAPAPKSTFSFSQALANLNKPKPTPETKKATRDRPPETEEERKRRERKEARRKLRVTFKPAESLEEIRLFRHDPEEEQGHDHSMLRDVGDMKNEGRMLKLYSQRVDLDDEEEYEPQFDEEELIAWHAPTKIDLTDADYNATMSNYITRGGTMEVESPEREAQEQRERNTLIAIYPSLSDIPPSPREPADPYSGPTSPEVAFGPPSDEIRARETQFYNSQRSPPTAAANAGGSDIDAILRMLNNTAQNQQLPYAQPQFQQPQFQQPSAQSSSAAGSIESIFAQFSNTSQQQQQQQPVDSSIQAALNLFNSQQQPPQQQQQQQQANTPPQQTQARQGGSLAAAAPTPDLSAVLSQLTGMQNTNNNDTDNDNNTQGGDRKRPFDGGDPYNDAKRNKGGMYKYKTQPCRFYREGTCKKGDSCTFQHD